MKNNKTMNNVWKIIFFGAIWGIVEGTLGYVLHFVPPTFAGFIMFPIATLILVSAYKSIGSQKALVYIGLIAALIKSVNFLLPSLMMFKTINPMISIILQSLVVAIAYPIISDKKISKKIVSLVGASISWRILFVMYMAIQYIITKHATTYMQSLKFSLNFIMFSGVISGLLASSLLWISNVFEKKNLKLKTIKPVYAIMIFMVAIGIQYII